jgi:hypothetical protein
MNAFPKCHARYVTDRITGALGRGFRVRDLACEDCPVKLSCLPASIERGVSDAVLEQDGEVEAYVNKRVPFEFVMARIAARQALRARGEPVPYELHPRVRIESPTEIAREPRWKVRRRDHPLTHSVRIVSQGVYRQYSQSDMPLPLPREIHPMLMAHRLARLDIGQDYPLNVGMYVIREVWNGPLAGTTITIVFRENGFETDGAIFGSLSSAVSHHLGYNRTGSRFINLRKDHTSLYDEHGQRIQ